MEVSSLRSKALLCPTGKDMISQEGAAWSSAGCSPWCSPEEITQRCVICVPYNSKAELQTHVWHPNRGIR